MGLRGFQKFLAYSNIQSQQINFLKNFDKVSNNQTKWKKFQTNFIWIELKQRN